MEKASPDRSTPAGRDTQPLQVTAALVREGGRFLITQRRSGRWEFPGGKKEPGESLAQALARELAEELALTVKVGSRFASILHTYPDRRVELHFFWCRIVAGRPRPVACQELAWASLSEMAGYDFLEADRRIIDRLRRETDQASAAPARP